MPLTQWIPRFCRSIFTLIPAYSSLKQAVIPSALVFSSARSTFSDSNLGLTLLRNSMTSSLTTCSWIWFSRCEAYSYSILFLPIDVGEITMSWLAVCTISMSMSAAIAMLHLPSARLPPSKANQRSYSCLPARALRHSCPQVSKARSLIQREPRTWRPHFYGFAIQAKHEINWN